MAFGTTYETLGPEGKVHVFRFLVVLFGFPQLYVIAYLLDAFNIKRPKNEGIVLIPLAVMFLFMNAFFFLTG